MGDQLGPFLGNVLTGFEDRSAVFVDIRKALDSIPNTKKRMLYDSS